MYKLLSFNIMINHLVALMTLDQSNVYQDPCQYHQVWMMDLDIEDHLVQAFGFLILMGGQETGSQGRVIGWARNEDHQLDQKETGFHHQVDLIGIGFHPDQKQSGHHVDIATTLTTEQCSELYHSCH